LTDRDHNDVLTLCECIAEAWVRGRYDEAEQWLDTAITVIGEAEFVDIDHEAEA
jgi:hypothetical protein